LLDPHHHIKARIDMATGEPPHLDERAREYTPSPMPIPYPAAQMVRHPNRTPIEQLSERIAVTSSNPADQPAQPLRGTARAERR
jgi:transposase